MKTKLLSLAILSVIILPFFTKTAFAQITCGPNYRLENFICVPDYPRVDPIATCPPGHVVDPSSSDQCISLMGSLPAGPTPAPLPPPEPIQGGNIPSNSGCTSKGGVCMDKSACNGTSESGLCMSPEYIKQTNVQCCIASKISPSGSSGGSIEIPNPLKTKSIAELIDRIVNYIIGIATLIFPLIIIYGAFQLLSTGGDMEKVTTARKTITYAVIGYILILLSKGVTMIVAQFLGVN